MKKYVIIYLATILVYLNSCKTLNGYYELEPGCGYNGIEFISKNEFIQYSNEGYDKNSNWNYGKYKRTNGGIILIYKNIPEKHKYESKNTEMIVHEETIKDSVEITISGYKHDSLHLDYYQAFLYNPSRKFIIGDDSFNGSIITLKIHKEEFPLKMESSIMGGNKIKLELIEYKNYNIVLYFDEFPTPKYDLNVGLVDTMIEGKDLKGKYIEPKTYKNQGIRYYKK